MFKCAELQTHSWELCPQHWENEVGGSLLYSTYNKNMHGREKKIPQERDRDRKRQRKEKRGIRDKS